MTQLMKTIEKVQRQLNPNLKIDGVLLTLADMRTKCIFRKNRALAPHERSAVPLGTDHCPVC